MSYHHEINGVDCFWMDEFRLTDVHVRLLSRLVLWFDPDTADGWYEFGSIKVDPKRPYGNSAVSSDILDEIGINWSDYCDENGEDGDESAYEANKEEVDRIHQEMGLAMTVVFESKSFEPGLYKRDRKSIETRDWHRVSD